ncbi:hypothetical protein FHS85_003450 [Rhodoligotrophos appendicifer]|uniref:hypothetical protein n=1 Tax=Rhodoligotrophos appendicifer TaxID=987056 RepID=UPI00118550F9|nr:hypothetical protein [Rhodoligotrophos appendicifer]
MTEHREVVVTDIKMPFWSMVRFLVKLAIASIPAMIILWLIGMALFAAIGLTGLVWLPWAGSWHWGTGNGTGLGTGV